MLRVLLALELLGLLLICAAIGVATFTYLNLWAALLASGIAVTGAAWLAERPVKAGDRGAPVRPSAPHG